MQAYHDCKDSANTQRIQSEQYIPMLKRTASDATARAGVYAVGKLIEKELGWIFRDQPPSDYGIDAQIETVEPGGQLKGRLLGAQIKSGRSYFDEVHGSGYVYRGEKKHLHYWLEHVLPVIVVLHDPDNDVCYWQAVTPDTISETNGGWKVIVPRYQKLDADAADDLRELTETAKEPHQQRLAQLLLEKPFMDMLQDGKRLFLHVEEWVNKSSGRGSLRLFTVNEEGEEDVVKDWPFVMFGSADYPTVLQELFPWASFGIDEDFYLAYDEETFDDNYGIWDSEEGRYVMHWADWDEWQAGLPRIRPYANVAAPE